MKLFLPYKWIVPSLFAVSAVYVGIYTYFYQTAPLNDFWNLFVMDGMPVLASIFCAAAATALWMQFERNDRPRAIWASLSAALWMWVIAEAYWMYYNMMWGEVPTFTLADVFWSIAYALMINSIRIQYQIIYHPSPKTAWALFALVIALILLITFAVVSLSNPNFSIGDYFLYFYPVADLFAGALALYLIVLFRRGTLLYPWLTLYAFFAADVLYIYVTETGLYDFLATNRSIFTLITDTSYIIAYLLLMIGCLAQFSVYRERTTQPLHPA
jgi:hypothetical protein